MLTCDQCGRTYADITEAAKLPCWCHLPREQADDEAWFRTHGLNADGTNPVWQPPTREYQ